MQSPDDSRDSSQPASSRTSSSSTTRQSSSTTTSSSRQPRSNPHQHLLQRTTANCPPELDAPQRTRWFKAATKAKRNFNLIHELPSFQYPNHDDANPIFIHHLTPHDVLQSLVERLRDVIVYVIDTEGDPPTQFQPEPIPSLLQIQAIHHQHLSSILLIETQHLPYPLSPTFTLIKQLCYLIFSSDNHIVAWGDPIQELIPYQQFGIFDLSHVQHTFNLQSHFTSHWNDTHPHCSTCPLRNQPVNTQQKLKKDTTSNLQVDLILYVDESSDSDDFPFSPLPPKQTQSCICPDTIRPYKKDTEQWALQTAVSYIFQEALDKKHTFNAWSCGLDPLLTEGQSSSSIAIRADMTSYAVNDVLAPTRLLFQLNHELIRPLRISSTTPISTTTTTDIQPTAPLDPHASSPSLPSYFLLSDSHAKYLDEIILTDRFKLQVHAISGLQWCHYRNPDLSVRSILLSNTLSHSLNVASAVMILVGTNSIRYVDAAEIILQVSYNVDYLHRTYPHLNRKDNICIVSTFPCLNISQSFPSTSSLSSNISLYNSELKKLSTNLNFTVIDFPVDFQHLSSDGMHLHFNHRHLILQSVQQYFGNLSIQSSSRPKVKQHSAAYKQRRNKVKHQKTKIKRQQFIITRSIDVHWKPKHIKHIIQTYNLPPARILEVHKGTLPIQFNNSTARDLAEATLPDDIFDIHHFKQYFSQEQ